MNEIQTLPIAETFHSVQGEGLFTGAPMHFIRLAGCPVGRPAKAAKMLGDVPIIGGAEAMVCSTWDGRSFWCDTNYQTAFQASIDDLIEQTWENHICLTGGEPLIHTKKLQRLFDITDMKDVKIHIETSGTVEVKLYNRNIWLTCAPKINALDEVVRRADELKFLVDEHFHPDNLTVSMRNHRLVWLSPINGVDTVNQANVQLTINWLRQFPNWRLSCQWHKFLGLR